MRPRWRSLGPRRPTTHRLRPEQSGGRRRNGFLVSRGMAALGVPMRLRHGVGAGRGRKSRRAVAAQAVEASAVLRPDQPIEEAVWSALGTDWQRRRWHATRLLHFATGFTALALAFQAQIPRTCNAAATARCRPATDWSVCHGHRLKKVQAIDGAAPARGRCSILPWNPIAPATDNEVARPSSVWSIRLVRAGLGANHVPAGSVGGCHAHHPEICRDADDGGRANDGKDDLPGFRSHYVLRDAMGGMAAGNDRRRDEDQRDRHLGPHGADNAKEDWPTPSVNPAARLPTRIASSQPAPVLNAHVPALTPTNNGRTKIAR